MYFKKYFFQKKKKKKGKPGVVVATPLAPLGVVSATPLGPWGRPSHPLVPNGVDEATPSGYRGRPDHPHGPNTFGGGFGHPLGSMGVAGHRRRPLASLAWPTANKPICNKVWYPSPRSPLPSPSSYAPSSQTYLQKFEVKNPFNQEYPGKYGLLLVGQS